MEYTDRTESGARRPSPPVIPVSTQPKTGPHGRRPGVKEAGGDAAGLSGGRRVHWSRASRAAKPG